MRNAHALFPQQCRPTWSALSVESFFRMLRDLPFKQPFAASASNKIPWRKSRVLWAKERLRRVNRVFSWMKRTIKNYSSLYIFFFVLRTKKYSSSVQTNISKKEKEKIIKLKNKNAGSRTWCEGILCLKETKILWLFSPSSTILAFFSTHTSQSPQHFLWTTEKFAVFVAKTVKNSI